MPNSAFVEPQTLPFFQAGLPMQNGPVFVVPQLMQIHSSALATVGEGGGSTAAPFAPAFCVSRCRRPAGICARGRQRGSHVCGELGHALTERRFVALTERRFVRARSSKLVGFVRAMTAKIDVLRRRFAMPCTARGATAARFLRVDTSALLGPESSATVPDEL